MGRPKLNEPSIKCATPKCRRIARVEDLCKQCHTKVASPAPQPGATPEAESATAPPPPVLAGSNGNGARPSRPRSNPTQRRLSPLEAEKLGRLRAEALLQRQSVRLIAAERLELQRKHEKLMADIDRKLREKGAEAKAAADAYDQAAAAMCQRHGVAREQALFDVDGRIIRIAEQGAKVTAAAF